MLTIKHIFVILAVIFGLIISLYITPKIVKLAPKPGEAPPAEFISAQKMLKIFSTTNMILGILIMIAISLR